MLRGQRSMNFEHRILGLSCNFLLTGGIYGFHSTFDMDGIIDFTGNSAGEHGGENKLDVVKCGVVSAMILERACACSTCTYLSG